MISFYPRSQSEGAKHIYVRITEGRGRQYRFATGLMLPSNATWVPGRGRIKGNRDTNVDVLNAQLSKIERVIEDQRIWAISNNEERSKVFYKRVLEEFRGERILEENRAPWTLEKAFRQFIAYHEDPRLPSSEKRSPGTLKTYKTGLGFLGTTNLGGYVLAEVDMKWYRSFVKCAELGGSEKEGLSKNYIGKLVKLVKSVLRFAEAQGETVHQAYRTREFRVLSEDVAHIYLTEDEIGLIQDLDLRDSPSLANTRDLFVVGCYTGLRYSDFSKLSEDDIKLHDGVRMFEVRSQKTSVRVSIPVHPCVEEILRARNGYLPRFQNDQLMNRNLKKLGEMAGLLEKVEIERTEGGNMRVQAVPKYKLLATHTARRSFCTNAYLKGLDTLDIMAISGHKTEQNFLRYIKVTRPQRAKRIASHPFFSS